MSCYSKNSFVHSNQISIYITLPSSRNLIDEIFTKINYLRNAPLENRNHSKLLILKEFSEADNQKKFVKTGVVNVLAKPLKNTYRFHFVSKVSGKMSLRINFFINNTLAIFQRWINAVSTLWITVQIM